MTKVEKIYSPQSIWKYLYIDWVTAPERCGSRSEKRFIIKVGQLNLIYSKTFIGNGHFTIGQMAIVSRDGYYWLNATAIPILCTYLSSYDHHHHQRHIKRYANDDDMRQHEEFLMLGPGQVTIQRQEEMLMIDKLISVNQWNPINVLLFGGQQRGIIKFISICKRLCDILLKAPLPPSSLPRPPPLHAELFEGRPRLVFVSSS